MLSISHPIPGIIITPYNTVQQYCIRTVYKDQGGSHLFTSLYWSENSLMTDTPAALVRKKQAFRIALEKVAHRTNSAELHYQMINSMHIMASM